MSRLTRSIKKEFKAALPATLYFLVVFHVTALTRGLMAETYGISPTGSAVATIGALIMGKVILILNKFAFTNRFASRPLIYSVLWKTLVFGFFGSLLQGVEEWVPLLSKYGSVAEASKNLRAEIIWPRFLANHIVLLLWLLVYCIVIELVRVLGITQVRRLFLGSDAPAPTGSGATARTLIRRRHHRRPPPS